jgi:hypothetical protein
LALVVIEEGIECHTCTGQLKEVRGCNGLKAPIQIRRDIPYELDKCIMKYIGYREMFYLQAYNCFMNGAFMEQGGMNDQYAKVIRAMNIIADYNSKRDKDGK